MRLVFNIVIVLISFSLASINAQANDTDPNPGDLQFPDKELPDPKKSSSKPKIKKQKALPKNILETPPPISTLDGWKAGFYVSAFATIATGAAILANEIRRSDLEDKEKALADSQNTSCNNAADGSEQSRLCSSIDDSKSLSYVLFGVLGGTAITTGFLAFKAFSGKKEKVRVQADLGPGRSVFSVSYSF